MTDQEIIEALREITGFSILKGELVFARKLKAAAERIRVLGETLRAVEWQGLTVGDDQPACLVCGGYQREGHAADCKVASSLSAARAAVEGAR